ncbi:DUF707 domain-containing protein [Chryseolinea lacunae]|uniref:DUF707 domain-containing protein n=1 Tax=Chryseolinea lacunae TaxID=2801331 RepID=A0ABS1KRM1_9BACT|nr:DUF707 domain-containing protein [Chryseolinea lacunae]MBL0742125.1 DUF707 domain-containing protein [Chryseolinea lacunae]
MVEKKGSKNLVVMPYGNTSLHSDWIFDDTARDFDVILLYYHADIDHPKLQQTSSAFSVRHYKSFKWWMIQQLFQEEPELLTRYEGFFFPDDDIVVSKADIHFLFYVTKKFNLALSQPALTRDSFKSWRALRRKHVSGMRYLSAVELMCPVMSAAAVRFLLPTFALTRSGWGLDILWGEQVRKEFGEKSIAVFDAIQVAHIKPVGKGELYEKLGMPAAAERDDIFAKYNITVQKIHTLNLPENNLLSRFKSFRMFRKLKAAQSL